MGLQTLIIGPAYTLASWASKFFDPFVLLLLRGMIEAVLFALFFFLTGGFRRGWPSRRLWRRLLLLAVLGVVLNQFLFILGLKYTPPTNSALIYSLTPMIVLFLASFLFGLERFTRQKFVAVLVALAGVVVVFYSLGRNFNFEHIIGNLITLGAITCWSFYLIFSRSTFRPDPDTGAPPTLDAVRGTAVVMMLGALLYLPFGLTQLPGTDFAAVTPRAWIGLANLVLINSIATYALFNYALTGLETTRVAIYMNLQPVSAAIFSLMLSQEELTLLFLLGGLLILVGVYLLNRARRAALRTNTGA